MKTLLKSFSTLAFLGLSFTQLSAQNTEEAKTLFGNGSTLNKKDLGFFVAPNLGITQFDGSTAALFNVRGGVVVKDKLSLGAFYNLSMNQIVPKSETIPNIYMDYWSVGGVAEYTIFSKNIFHVSLPLYIGYGEVQMDNDDGDAGLGEANFFQIEPSALLEVNLHKHVRFNLGAGYRIVNNMTYRNFNQSDISGLTGYVGLKFGLFR